MDISAPGGALNEDGRIWSTTTKLAVNYEYLAGTSMACPLVSGVAALVIEKYGVGKKGFTRALRVKSSIKAHTIWMNIIRGIPASWGTDVWMPQLL